MAQTDADFDFRSTIEAAVSKFEKAANTKDAAALAGIYAEDATLLPPD